MAATLPASPPLGTQSTTIRDGVFSHTKGGGGAVTTGGGAGVEEAGGAAGGDAAGLDCALSFAEADDPPVATSLDPERHFITPKVATAMTITAAAARIRQSTALGLPDRSMTPDVGC